MKQTWQILKYPLAEPISLEEAKLHLRVDGDDDDTLITSLIKAAREYCENYQNRTYIATTYKLKLSEWETYIELPRPPLCYIDSITYIDANGTEQTLSSMYYESDIFAEPGVVYEAYQKFWPNIRGTRNDITITYTAGYSAVFTAETTDVCTCSGRTFTDGDVVVLRNSGGALPTGLSANTNYYIRDVSGYTFKLAATSGGTAIDITAAGTGTHYVGLVPESIVAAMKLLIGHWYENRETVLVGSISKEFEFTLEALLYQQRVITL